MTTRSDNIRTFVLLMTGPIVWAAQFMGLYALAGLACGATPLEGYGFVVISGLIIATSALFLLGFTIFRFVRPTYLREVAGAEWARASSIGLALLSIFAILLGVAPLVLFPGCGG